MMSESQQLQLILKHNSVSIVQRTQTDKVPTKFLDLAFISSLLLSPQGAWKAPSRHIHLSSQSFSRVHCAHLHFAPPWCPTVSSCSTEVSRWSRSVQRKCLRSLAPVSAEQPSLKCLLSQCVHSSNTIVIHVFGEPILTRF